MIDIRVKNSALLLEETGSEQRAGQQKAYDDDRKEAVEGELCALLASRAVVELSGAIHLRERRRYFDKNMWTSEAEDRAGEMA